MTNVDFKSRTALSLWDFKSAFVIYKSLKRCPVSLAELKELQRFLKKKTASVLVVRGRRRVGKSRLIQEFAKPHRCIQFVGLQPTGLDVDREEHPASSSAITPETSRARSINRGSVATADRVALSERATRG